MSSIDQIITSICWTLLHSLWQGAILLVIGSVLFHAMRNAKATVRYWFLLSFLVIFILAVIVTFFYEWSGFRHSQYFDSGVSGNSHSPEQSVFAYNQLQNILTDWINSHAWWLVIIWGIVCVYHMSVLCFNYKDIQKMRYEQVYPVSEKWLQKLENLKVLLQIRTTILMQESTLVSVPIVMGIVRPLILVPVGMLNTLRLDEIEAILLHELAHVKRYDFLINLIQKVLQTVFFFNPGYIWLSKMLKVEREYCCDEIAVSITGERKGYVKALVSFHEYQQRGQFVQAFASEREVLLGRAKKLVTGNRSSLSKQEKKITAVTFLMLCCILYLLVAFRAPSAILINASKKDSYSPLTEQVSQNPQAISQTTHERNTGKEKILDGNGSIKSKQPKYEYTDTIDANDFLTINTRVIETPSNQVRELSALKKNGTTIKVILSSGGIKQLIVNDNIVEETRYNSYKEEIRVLQKKAEQPIPVSPPQFSEMAHKVSVMPNEKQTSKQLRLGILTAEIQQLEEDQKALEKALPSEEQRRQILLRRQIIEAERRVLLNEEGG